MTPRDPSERDSFSDLPDREPTASLSIAASDPHPSLALGTSGDRHTKVDSPSAQRRPPSAQDPGPQSNDPADRVGIVFGSYRVLELIGKGGMGHVYRAEHIKLGREVALKVLRQDYARRRDAVARFFQEARTVNRVRHRNIVDVTDFVELDDGTTFIIMELLRGQSLGKWSRSGIDLARALAVLVQICDGLAAAHQVGVIHRDLKPDNIVIVPTPDGAEQVKLLDFGVAKLVNREDEDVGFQTAAGSVIGTPAYMSPEQAGGMVVDGRSDIYSLGAIMYEMFCGQPMFRGRSFGEYVRKHLTEMPPLPRTTAGGYQIDPRLELVILRCIEKSPDARFTAIAELRESLLGLLGGESPIPTITSSAVVALTPTPMPPHYPSANYSQVSHLSQIYSQAGASQIQLAPPPPRTTPWWTWFFGGAIAVAIGISGALWYARKDSRRVEPVVREPTRAEPTRPVVVPQDEPPAKPRITEVKFDSLPSGGVYAEGRSAELCRTPCSFNIDLGDGGSTERRTYIVRADGYIDHPVMVDLTGSQRSFAVTLASREAPVSKEPTAATDKAKPAVTGRPVKKPKDPKRSDEKGDGSKIDQTELSDPFKKGP